jgi:hypothetical protein
LTPSRKSNTSNNTTGGENRSNKGASGVIIDN